MELNKLDVARQEIDSAIWLFYNLHNPAAIDVLAGAAWDICRVLNEKNSNPSLRQELIRDHAHKFKTSRDLMNVINRNYNFCKHADNDPNDILELKLSDVDLRLFSAVNEYSELAGTTISMDVFVLWVIAVYPQYFSYLEKQELKKTADHYFPQVVLLSRDEQIKLGQSILLKEQVNLPLYEPA